MHKLYALARLSSVSALLLSSLSFAQAPAPRIRGSIERSPSTTLQGSLNPHIRTADDLGPLAPDTAIHGVTLVFKRSDAQEADLQQLLAQQADTSSPLYHHWLTPDEFATRFGLADADIAATESWLQSHGFTIDEVSRGRDRITFSGSAAQIQGAFGAELHRFRSNNEDHFAPAAELSLPPSLAPVTAAILHLSDFRPRPNVRAVHPDYTTLSSQTHFLAPKDLYNMYDLSTFQSESQGVGGQGLAIVGQSYVNTGSNSVIQKFLVATTSGSASINPVIVPGSGNEAIFSGDVSESEIDLEYSSSLADFGKIFFVYTGVNPTYDVFDSLAYAITSDIAPVISASYGECEPLISSTDLQQYNAVLEQAAAQGQTVIASSGDSGPNACAPVTASSVTLTQQQQLAVSFPASSPYVTAVGGTQMAPGTFDAGTSNYWASATSTDTVQSLLSYVPEVVWNEDSPANGIMSSGGGISSSFARPSWQAGVPGIPAGNNRLVPDIALQASVSSPGYVICTDDPDLGSLVDCSSGLKASNGQYLRTGGTSFAAPIFASLLTNLTQYKQSPGFGNINPILYSLAAQPSVYLSAFHDITSGTTACAVGDGNCGTPGTSGYAATTGYDMATGLGSLDFTNLANAWPSTPSNGAVASYIQVTGIPATATAGAISTVTMTVNVGCGLCTPPAPTGSISVSVDGGTPVVAALVSSSNPVALSASTTGTFTAPATTGTHIVVVRYPGDANHLPSSSTSAVLVGNVVPSGSLSLSVSNLSIANNATGHSQVTITPTGGYSGALVWSASVSTTSGSTSETLCYLIQTGSITGPTTASLQLGAGTACGSVSSSVSRTPVSVQRSSVERPSPLRSHKGPAATVFVGLLVFGFLRPRHRKLIPVLFTAVLAMVSPALTGCGGGGTSGSVGGSSGGGSTNPTANVYTITLTAHDSVNTAITASTTFTLTVN